MFGNLGERFNSQSVRYDGGPKHNLGPVSEYMEFENKKQTIEDKKLVVKEIGQILKKVSKEIPETKKLYEQIEYYNNTTHDRNFFTQNRNGGSVAEMLFNMPTFAAKSEEGKKFFFDKLNDKTIHMYGGGDSMKDLISSVKIDPMYYINFDKYLKMEPVGKSLYNRYQSYPISASDIGISQNIKKDKLPKADEIWATCSVPFYLDTREEIKNLFTNIYDSLNEGGTARIYPIAIQAKETGENNFDTRKEALMEALNELAERSNINIKILKTTTDGYELIIQKIKDPNVN